MLTETDLNITSNHADAFMRRGEKLEAKAGSYLAQVLEFVPADLPLLKENFSNESIDALVARIRADKTIMDGEQTAYDILVNQLALDGADAIKKHLAMARGQIVPYVRDIHQYVVNKLSKRTPESLLSRQIIPFEYPELLRSRYLLAAVEQHCDESIVKNRSTVSFPRTFTEDLTQIMLTGNPEYDEEIKKWMAGKTDEILEDYKEIFINQTFEFLDFNRCLNMFLFSNGMITKNIIFEETTGTELDHRTFLNSVRTLSAIGIRNLLNDEKRNLEQGRLIISKTRNSITVNKLIYDKWMNDGGTVDLIYAAANSKDNIRTVNEILSRQDELMKNWNTAIATIMRTDKLNQLLLIKDALYEGFDVKLIEDMEKGVISDTDRNEYLKTFRRKLDFFSIDDVPNMMGVIIRILIDVRFTGLDLDMTLGNITRLCEETPDKDPKEAATVTTISYISQWIASQIDVVRK